MPTLHPSVSFALVLLGTLAWLALPFVPAILELVRPRDAVPLDAVGRDSGALTHFADGFRRYLAEMEITTDLDALVANAPRPVPESPTPRSIARVAPRFALRDGTPAMVLRNALQLPSVFGEDHEVPAMREIGELVVVDHAATLPSDVAYAREVYARGDTTFGERGVLRALLAERSATLGAESTVLRWVHAESRLVVRDGCTLDGRATAGDEIRLGEGVRFTRMLAPRIVVGCDDGELTPPLLAEQPHSHPWIPDNATRMASDTMRIEGDVTMPADAYASGHIVVTGSLVVGAGSRIDGSVKAHGDVIVEDRCLVSGTITARRTVRIGAGCRVAGPVIAEGEVHIAADTWLGQPTRPTTITAPVVVLTHGVTVFGAVHAGVEGRTVPAARADVDAAAQAS